MDLQLSHRCCDCQAPGASVVSTLWNSSLNQIVAGGSDGARVLYSPEMSTKGFEPAVKLSQTERCALCRGNAVCRSEGSSCEHTGSSLGNNDLQSTCTPVVSSQSYVCLFDGVQCPRLFAHYLFTLFDWVGISDKVASASENRSDTHWKPRSHRCQQQR